MGIRFKLTYAYVYGMRQGPTYRHDTYHFYPRDAVFTTATCQSVRLSVARWYCVKTKKASVTISSLSGSPTILVF